ncbi:DUF4159 domain-containing protein [Roseovarius sp. EL26]|uniref:DUF4159 domain-containing protein n=1 Tax=Roseovarius sp. EL26 TaxID=2126672 RepID=UPI000EA2ED68|nr:DUF4159 domain-containing protein [Roseovarius sp. EL26]
MTLGAIGFSAPLLLLALIILPVLWFILRAIPPAPVRRRFPGVALLLGLRDEDSSSDRTPWWLLLLRMLAVAAIIIGLAGPVLNPHKDPVQKHTGPLLIVLDASWASAADWSAQRTVIESLLAEAGREARPTAMLHLSTPEPLTFRAATDWRGQLGGMAPAPWSPDPANTNDIVALLGDGPFETRWFSDGLARNGRDTILAALQSHGPVTIHQGTHSLMALSPPVIADGDIVLTAHRLDPLTEQAITIQAHGRDPTGTSRLMASLPLSFDAGERATKGILSLPAELRARLTRFQIAGQSHAGAVSLTGDTLKQREIALIAGREDREGLELLSPLHYLEQAFLPAAHLLEGSLLDILPANPDVIILADVATLTTAEEEALLDWANNGGTLLRFAGPRLAASDIARSSEPDLMPVRLRAGGRMIGGAMSWGAPKTLAPFAEDSPFFGLPVPDEVSIAAQVMAQPDPTLAERVIAQLTDGTPLVTRKRLGAGQVVLFHVTANAEWSSLPLSGLFVQMLDRLATSSAAAVPDMMQMQGTTWQPVQVLDGFGRLTQATTLPGVDGARLISEAPGPTLQPGVYDGPDRRLALNIIPAEPDLRPAEWPDGLPISDLSPQVEKPLGGWLLSLALLLLMTDIMASLALTGRLLPTRTAVILCALFLIPGEGHAQDSKAQYATNEVVLAYVLTGDTKLDRTSDAGLRGLGSTLFFRTSIEPANPIGIDLETDELSFYPLIYWPITPDQPQPSDLAYTRLNDYLRTGGLILFDTRDANIAGFSSASPNGNKLQRLAAPLDIPPLEPIPRDHVLTRTFYLLQDFPGRFAGQPVWAEAAPPNAEQIEGMPFRNLNDGVTPVIIGGNDWAAAWAISDSGAPLYPVGRGYSGERQRELAYRFGINLVMHVLTGNYKSDQVHVPALLDRLGQ